ncbi:unnamed protein product, partial [Didymodactylos carnosus]
LYDYNIYIEYIDEKYKVHVRKSNTIDYLFIIMKNLYFDPDIFVFLNLIINGDYNKALEDYGISSKSKVFTMKLETIHIDLMNCSRIEASHLLLYLKIQTSTVEILPLEYCSEDTIEIVKEKIKKIFHIPLRQQRLEFHVIDLIVIVMVYITTSINDILSIEIRLNAKLKHIKAFIQKECILYEQPKLFYNGKLLDNDN